MIVSSRSRSSTSRCSSARDSDATDPAADGADAARQGAKIANSADVEAFKGSSRAENLKEMGTNPLLLALQIGVHAWRQALPELRTELYDKGVRLPRRVEVGTSGTRTSRSSAAMCPRLPSGDQQH